MLPLMDAKTCMLASVVIAGALCCAGAQVPSPALPSDALLRVQFETHDGQLTAPGDSVGTAFLLHVDSVTVFAFTAYHLFTAAGVSDDSLSVQVRRVQVHPVGQPELLLEAGEAVVARSDLDVAAFRFPGHAPVTPLHLANQPPQLGETVWLMAQLQGPCALMPLLHKAVVDSSAGGLLTYRFRNQRLLLGEAGTPLSERYRCFWRTSGSPVLDSRGKVVGMAVGVDLTDAGALYGIAVPGDTVRECLRSNKRLELGGR